MRGLVWGVAVSLIAAGPAGAAGVESWATYPGPTFLENLIVDQSRTVLFTNQTGRSLEARRPDGSVSTFVKFDDLYPVSIAAVDTDTFDGFVMVAHDRFWTEGAAALGSGRIVTLADDGTVLDSVPVPQAQFLNGITVLPDGTTLVADSVGAQILRFDPATLEVTPWFAHDTFAAQTDPYFLPGINGLKLAGDTLYLTSSARRTLYRLAVGPDGAPAGQLAVVAEGLPGADDFLVLLEGGFVVSTHADSVVHLALDGGRTVITDDRRVAGNTAVALFGTGADRQVVVLGTGDFTGPAPQDAVVVAVPFPAP